MGLILSFISSVSYKVPVLKGIKVPKVNIKRTELEVMYEYTMGVQKYVSVLKK